MSIAKPAVVGIAGIDTLAACPLGIALLNADCIQSGLSDMVTGPVLVEVTLGAVGGDIADGRPTEACLIQSGTSFVAGAVGVSSAAGCVLTAKFAKDTFFCSRTTQHRRTRSVQYPEIAQRSMSRDTHLRRCLVA